jgi:hypothetical protein
MIVVHIILKTKPIQAIKKVSNKLFYFFLVIYVGAFYLLMIIISNLVIIYVFEGTAIVLLVVVHGEGFWRLVITLCCFMPMAVCGCIMYEKYEAKKTREKTRVFGYYMKKVTIELLLSFILRTIKKKFNLFLFLPNMILYSSFYFNTFTQWI